MREYFYPEIFDPDGLPPLQLYERCRKPSVVFVGSGGCGKSTLLNCLIGCRYFGADDGVNGASKTTEVAYYENSDYVFVETPDLTDPENMEEAAGEATDALKESGSLKLVFVCCVENDCVRAEDIDAFRRIMSSISHADYQQHKILVVLNKLSAEQHRDYTEDAGKAAEMGRRIMGSRRCNPRMW